MTTIETDLVGILDDVTYEDLISDLVRYGDSSEEECRVIYPRISATLVRAAAEVADECPVCLQRFINLTGVHYPSCRLVPLFVTAPDKPA